MMPYKSQAELKKENDEIDKARYLRMYGTYENTLNIDVKSYINTINDKIKNEIINYIINYCREEDLLHRLTIEKLDFLITLNKDQIESHYTDIYLITNRKNWNK